MSRAWLWVMLLAGGLISPLSAHADETYVFSCPESSIKGSLSYSVIGTYHALYTQCSGRITYDPLHAQVKSVDISIKSASIKSPLRWCDNIVRSKRVLDCAKYPFITFKSHDIQNLDDGPWARGILKMHGIARRLRSRFVVEGHTDGTLLLKGTWDFNRKKFNVIWSKVLDHGGVVVGDDVTVDWKIRAHKI